jgi:hypothetical protein
MKILFSKKEYRLLLDMMYLSDWMMNSHHSDPELHNQEYSALRKKILSYHKEMGLEEIIEYSSADDEYYELSDYEDELQEKFIEPYEDEVFWDELSDRLAERDLIRKIGVDKFEAMDVFDRVNKTEEIRERYLLEFERHGLERIQAADSTFTEELKILH